MSDEQPRKRRWTPIWKCLLLLVVCLFVVYPLAMNIEAFYFARHWAEMGSGVALRVQPLRENHIAEIGDGVTISRFGYSLQVPWPKIKSRVDRGTLTSLTFDDGSSLMMFDPAKEPDILSAGQQEDANTQQVAEGLFSADERSSHYKLEAAAMDAVPSDASLFRSRRWNARVLMLLTQKMTDVPMQPTAIFAVGSKQMKGFQVGDPSAHPKLILLKLYDMQDRPLTLWIMHSAITQEQINAIVASIRPTN